MRKIFATTLLSLLAFMVLSTASPAFANSLISTNPTMGSIVNSSPSAISLRTTDALLDLGNSVTVTDPQGNRVDDGTLSVDGTNIVAGLKLLKVSGVYTVAYTFFTDNDVPLEGTYTFSFKAPGAIASQSPSAVIVEPTPIVEPANASGAPTFIILLMMSAFLVFVGLSLYAWKIIAKR